MSYITYQGKRVSFGGSHNLKLPDINTGLVGYWNLDEPSGFVAYDLKHICDGINSAPYPLITNSGGKIANCKYFPETSNVIVVENYNTIQQLQGKISFSISLWFKINSYPSQVGTGSYGLYNVWGDPNWPITIFVNNADDKLSTRFGTVDGYEYPGIDFNPSVGVWYHYVAVLPQGDNPKFYLDGSLIHTYPFTIEASFAQSTYNTYIGAAGPGSWDADHYIDEVGLWKRALSESEVQLLYNSGAGRTFPFVQNRQNLLSNIVAYWKLDETSGDTLYDIVGNNNCTYQDISLGAIGKINYSPFITDSGAAIIMSSSISSVFQPGVFSISAWVKFDELPSVLGHSQTIFSIGGSGPLTGIIFTFGNYGTNRFLFQAYESDTNTNGFYSPTITNINSFIHLCITYEGPGKTSTLYINGVASASDNITLPLGTLGVTHTLANTSQYNYDAIYGKIDEVGVWNRALTPTDVSLLYNSGYGRTYPFNEYFDNNIGIVRNGTFDTSAYWDLTGAGLDTYISNGRLYFHNVTYTEVIQTSTNMISPIKPNTDYVLNFDVDISTESVGTMRLKFVNETHAVDYVAYNNYAANSHVVNFKTPSDIGTGGFGIRYGLGYEGDGGYIDNVRLREKY
jgi:hypothetical protein